MGYKEAEREIRQVLRSDRKAAQKLLSAYMNLLTIYPDQPYDQHEIVHPITGLPICKPENAACFDDILPKEDKVLEIVREKISVGERVLIYTSWTRTDSQQKLVKLLTGAGICTEVLTPAISPDKREAWVEKKLRSGCQVLILKPLSRENVRFEPRFLASLQINVDKRILEKSTACYCAGDTF